MAHKGRIKLWITALRSGVYPQGIGQLKRTTGVSNAEYCCLGVAADLFILNCPNKANWYMNGVRVEDRGEDFIEDLSLPTFIMDWYEISNTQIPAYIIERGIKEGLFEGLAVGPHAYSLENLNDDVKATFPMIATLLEWKYLEETPDAN